MLFVIIGLWFFCGLFFRFYNFKLEKFKCQTYTSHVRPCGLRGLCGLRGMLLSHTLKASKIKILKKKNLRKSKKCVQLAKFVLCTYVGTFSAVSQYIVGIKITYSKHLCITFIHSFLFYTQLGTGNNLKVRFAA